MSWLRTFSEILNVIVSIFVFEENIHIASNLTYRCTGDDGKKFRVVLGCFQAASSMGGLFRWSLHAHPVLTWICLGQINSHGPKT